MRLTQEELHIVWSDAQGRGINPKWLISMVEEIRVWRNMGNAFMGLIDTVENRCMAVTPTLREMTNEEFGTIYKRIHAALR